MQPLSSLGGRTYAVRAARHLLSDETTPAGRTPGPHTRAADLTVTRTSSSPMTHLRRTLMAAVRNGSRSHVVIDAARDRSAFWPDTRPQVSAERTHPPAVRVAHAKERVRMQSDDHDRRLWSSRPCHRRLVVGGRKGATRGSSRPHRPGRAPPRARPGPPAVVGPDRRPGVAFPARPVMAAAGREPYTRPLRWLGKRLR